MQQDSLYRFLNSVRGSWRNAVYVECRRCPYGQHDCSDFLLTTNADGVPLIYPVREFQQKTGEQIDRAECTTIISQAAFWNLFYKWLLWNVKDPSTCSILQILPK